MRGPGLLTVRECEPATLLVRGAHVVDPGAGIDARTDVLVRAGVIAALGDDLVAPDDAEVVDADGLTLLPGLRRSARAPPNTRAGARGGHRVGHGRRCRRRFRHDPRDAEHRPGGRLRLGHAGAARARGKRGGRRSRLPRRDLARPARSAARGARRRSPTPALSGSRTTDGRSRARACCGAPSSTPRSRVACSRCTARSLA